MKYAKNTDVVRSMKRISHTHARLIRALGKRVACYVRCMASNGDKILPKDSLTKVRHALYDAKLALESSFDGEEKAKVIRTIVDALDATAILQPADCPSVLKP